MKKLKKVLGVALATITLIAAIPVTTVYANDVSFDGLLDWNGLVFENVDNIIDVEGTLAVGGNFNSTTGFSANSGAYGLAPASTDDTALLVNGNVNIAGYGNIYGQTIIGAAEGNTYKLSNVISAQTLNGQYIVADYTDYFANAQIQALNVNAAIEALPANGIYDSAYGTYTFTGNSEANVLVYNVEESNFNSYLFDFTIAETQTIVVNFRTTNKIDLRYGAIQINGSTDPEYLRQFNRNIVLNVVNATDIEMTSCELYGILLAPNATLTGKGANICGTTIVNNLVGSNGFELHVGYNNDFVPTISTTPVTETTVAETEPEVIVNNEEDEIVNIRIDVPRKMAVAFADGTVYYGGEIKEVIVGAEYLFRMCAVNWNNGVYDENGNGLAGTIVYRMIALHHKDYIDYAFAARDNAERYIVKGIDVIDNETKTIYVNCDAMDTHLETDVNSFFMAYRFHFADGDYNKQTGIAGVIETPRESLSVNLPIGTTITCNAYVNHQLIDTDLVFITNNSGEGIYEDEYLTSVNDYTWNH